MPQSLIAVGGLKNRHRKLNKARSHAAEEKNRILEAACQVESLFS